MIASINEYLKTNPSFTPTVVGYLVKGDEVLLGLRKQVSWGLGLNLISGLGGKVGDKLEFKTESFEDALVREIEEEVGIRITAMKIAANITFLFPFKPKWNQHMKAFIVTEWEGEAVESEAIKPIWYKKDNLPFDQMWEDNAIFLPRVLSGEYVEKTFMYGLDNKTLIEVI